MVSNFICSQWVKTVRSIVMSGLIVLVLVGCTGSAPKKTYIDPIDPESQRCVSQCNVVKTNCRKRQTDTYKFCVDRRKYYQREYELCVKSGNPFCSPVDRCPLPATSVCTQQYDQCFNACGGIIEEEEPEQT